MTTFTDSYRTDLNGYDYCGDDGMEDYFSWLDEQEDVEAADTYILFTLKGEIKL